MATPRLVLVVCSILLALLTSACGKLTAEALQASKAALTEESALGTLTWSVAQDGTAHLLVKDPAGKIVKEGVSGQLVFKGSADEPSEEQTVPLKAEGDEGVLRASGPKLQAELNEVRYSLEVAGKPWTGTLHLPQDGTEGINRAAVPGAASGVDQPGPHGGTIQMAGEHRYEVVGDAESGDVRVYVLDAELKPAVHRPEVIKLAVDADQPEVVGLELSADGTHYVGKLRGKKPPKKLTILVRDQGKARVAVVGWRPGVVIHLDRPGRKHYWGKRKWHPRGRALGHHKRDHYQYGPKDRGHGKPFGGKHKSKRKGKHKSKRKGKGR